MTRMSTLGGSYLVGRAKRAAAVTAAVGAVGAAGLAGCDQVSEETRAAGAAVVCSKIEFEPSEIEQNPEAARLVALLVRDFAPDEDIRNIADRVADDPTVLSPRAQLADWVADRCGGSIGGGSGAGGSGSGGGGGGGDGGGDGDGDGGGDD